MRRRVYLESPYAGNVAENLRYAHACIADCLRRGEAPIASHVLYTTALDDADPDQRAAGIAAGLSFLPVCEASVVYADRGISPGMRLGIAAAERLGIPVEYRRIYF